MNPTTAAEMFAYPVIGARWGTSDYPGLTKREMFAAMVMAGLAANPGGPWQSNAQNGWGLVNCLMEDVAFTATTAADALLAELAKGGAA